MKKTISILLILCVAFACNACTAESSDSLSTDTLDVSENHDMNRRSTNIYLTKDKFFYTSYDRKNSVGDQYTAYVKDIKSGKEERLMSFDAGNVSNMAKIGDSLFFTCLADKNPVENGDTACYCLMRYIIDKKHICTIFESPVSYAQIIPVVMNGKIFFTAVTQSRSEYDEYQLFMYNPYDDNTTAVIDDIENVSSVDFYKGADINKAYLLLYAENSLKSYLVDKTGKAKIIKNELVPEHKPDIDTYKDKPVCGQFGEYIIVEDKMPDEFLRCRHRLGLCTCSGSCSFKYKSNYYLTKKGERLRKIAERNCCFYYT